MNIAHWKTGYTFYFDTYGNVIGCTDKAASTEYVVMDKIWGVKEDGDFVIKANLYDLSGNPIEKVTVSAKAGSFKGCNRRRCTESLLYWLTSSSTKLLTS